MPHCSGCKNESPVGARFCVHCGTPMPRHKFCPQCGTAGEPEARFCRECGTAFPDSGIAPPASSAPALSMSVPPPLSATPFAPPVQTETAPPAPRGKGGGRSRKKPRAPISSGGIIKLTRKGTAPEVIAQRLATAFQRPAGPPHPLLARMQYKNPFRKSQQDVLDAAARWVQDGQHQMHVVAPPGSGKTILGLEMVHRLGRPALILAPNTAIQGQWVDKCRGFLPADVPLETVATDDGAATTPIISLTYQALTTATSDDQFIGEAALGHWRDELTESRKLSAEEAQARIERMRDANPDDYKREVASRKAKVRQQMLADPDFDVTRLLHPNARALVDRLRAARFGTIVLDECHHLTGFWALVVADLVGRLDGPVILGLTATPPVDRDDVELSRYLDLVGDIDFQVPTPAVVKEGHLAPYQDLVMLTQPLPQEQHFIASQHEQFAQLVRRLIVKDSDFLQWLDLRINQRRAPADIHQPPASLPPVAPWPEFAKAHPGFAEAGARLLRAQERPLAADIPLPRESAITLTDWAFVLEDYALNALKLSGRDDHHEMLADIASATRALGLVLTESGFRPHTSPVDRVLALSGSKIEALTKILGVEAKALGPDLRALVLTDYEKTSATAVREVEGILDEQAGGAFAVVRALVMHPDTDPLDPVLVTGSSVVCDADMVERFLGRARAWLEASATPIALTSVPLEGLKLCEIKGEGPLWSTRTYVRMVTALFEEGTTRCLVGTRGLLGEGWDALSINALVDLTAVTAFMTTNQLRGRSLRIDPRAPRKVADNWDVVCLAPTFEKGFNDYERFVRKHLGFHGLCDDGQIASGVSHVHPALTRSAPNQIGPLIEPINAEMLERPAQRARVYEAWKVGQPYRGVEVATVEVRVQHEFGEPPVRRAQGLLQILGQVFSSTGGHTAQTQSALTGMSTAVLAALQESGQIAVTHGPRDVTLSLRSDGFYRVLLERATPEHAALFARSVLEVLSPLQDQRYLIPRFEQQQDLANRVLGAMQAFGFGPSGSDGGLRLAQWHAVPEALGTSKEVVSMFARHWNAQVSPGQPVFARRPEGQRVLEQYRQQNPLGVQTMQRTVWQ